MAGFSEAIALLPRVIVEAVLNGLWQGTALAVLTWLLLRMVPRNPRVCCAAWSVCLAAILCLPLAHVATRLWPAPFEVHETRHSTPAGSPYPGLRSPRIAVSDSPAAPAVLVPANAASLLILGWVGVSLLLGVRLIFSYRNVARLKRESTALSDPDTDTWARRFAAGYTRRGFEIRSSEEVRLPMLAGLAKPAILFPRTLLPLLSAEEKCRICLHELAHIRRRDDWANLLQRAAEALLFFHPAIRWVGKRLSLERELACDDWVVSVSGAVRPYAVCLVRLAELVSLRPHPSPALGSASDRKQIQRRIEMLLNPKRNEKPLWSKAVFAAVVVACLAAGTVAARLSPVIAVQDQPASAEATPGLATPQVPPEPPAPPAAPLLPAAPQAPEAGRNAPVPAAEQSQTTPEQNQLAQEEIRKLTEEIQREVETNLRAKTEEIQKLAEQIREKVQQSIQPQVREISELARKLAQEESASPRNEESIRKLQEQIERHQSQIDRVSEQEVKGLEQQIHQLEEAIKPSEEQIHRLEAKIHEIEKQMRGKEREYRSGGHRNPPPLPPAPPAPAAPPPPPLPPPPPQ